MPNNTPGQNGRRKINIPLLVMRILFTLFMAGSLLLIFSASSEAGAVSGAKSAAVTAWLNQQMGAFGIGFSFTEGLVRKLGHLGEYTLLGFWTMLTVRVYSRRILSLSAWPMLLGLLVAVLDEFNQLQVPGRSGLISDILIDFTGVLLGVCLALFIQLLAGAIARSFKERRGRTGDVED